MSHALLVMNTEMKQGVVIVSLLVLFSCGVSCALETNVSSKQVVLPTETRMLEGLELIWQLTIGSKGWSSAIASDASKGVVYAMLPFDEGLHYKVIAEINSNGKLVRKFTMRKEGRLLHSGHLQYKTTRDLLSFTKWVGELVAMDTNGAILWKYGSSGINEVWTADLNGDGFDEVIIGYNGFTGLHVIDRNGKLLWKSKGGANIWHVCTADLDGNGKPEVISTSAKGDIRVFGTDGMRLADIRSPPGYYGDLVRPVKLSKSGSAEGILLTGGRNRIAAVKGDGELAWEVELPTALAGDIAEPAPHRPWIAVVSGGRFAVLNTITGSILAKTVTPTSDVGSGNCYMCWLEIKGQNSPLLILSSPQSIAAYRVIHERKSE